MVKKTILATLFFFLSAPTFGAQLKCLYPSPDKNSEAFRVEYKAQDNAFWLNGYKVWKNGENLQGPTIQVWKLTENAWAFRDLKGKMEYVVNFKMGKSWMKGIGQNEAREAECH